MSFQGLLIALNSLIDIHDELLQLARDKVTIVVQNDVDALMALTAKETRLIARLEDSFREMGSSAAGSWKEIGLTARPGSRLSDLIQAVPRADHKTELRALTAKLKERHNELKVINERNQLLIQQSLELIRYELDLIAGPSEQEITYAPTSAGQGYVGGASRRSFDTRA